ncbi:MAG TPA: hypothetical protein VF889_08460, partial [Bacteroidota bacterium]
MAIMTLAYGTAHDYDLAGRRYQAPVVGERAGISTIMVVSLTEVAAIADHEAETTCRALFAYKDLIGRIVGENNGNVLHAAAGCITACFVSAQDALRAAVRIQAVMDECNLHNIHSGPVLARIGLHTVQEGKDWQEDPAKSAVTVAEYCESLAHGGEIVLTGETMNGLHDRDGISSLFMKTVTLRESPPHLFTLYQAVWNPTEVEVAGNASVKDSKSSLLPSGRKLAAGLLVVICYLGLRMLGDVQRFHPQKSRTID